MQQHGTRKDPRHLERLLVAFRQQMLTAAGHVRRKVITSILSTSCRKDSRILARPCRMPRKQPGNSMGVSHCSLPRFVSLLRKVFWKTNQPKQSLLPTPTGPLKVFLSATEQCPWLVPEVTPNERPEGRATGCNGQSLGALVRDSHSGLWQAQQGYFLTFQFNVSSFIRW